MEGTVHMKSVAGEWFATLLVLDSGTNQMTWTKQDGKSSSQYNIAAPVEVQPRVGQSRKFCFEVFNPTTKRSFMVSAKDEDEQLLWIQTFDLVLQTPGKELVLTALPSPPLTLPSRSMASLSITSESTRPASSSSVSEPSSRPAALSSVSTTSESKKSSMVFETAAAAPPISGSNCVVCNSPVYKMEEVIVDKMMMHKQCFQCEHCKRQLTMGNFACINGGMFYCKPHYFEVFSQSGGKYEKAFGDAGFEKKALTSFTPL
ncbi:hypothetical protein BASA81_001787 [Batrachochytrium salamandrivorans]|nr:hypothetical protein BASA81_001787 [Batrachochytrium salamandrivorans]